MKFLFKFREILLVFLILTINSFSVSSKKAKFRGNPLYIKKGVGNTADKIIFINNLKIKTIQNKVFFYKIFLNKNKYLKIM